MHKSYCSALRGATGVLFGLFSAAAAFAQTATTAAVNETDKEVVKLEQFVVKEQADFADQAIVNSTPVSFTGFDKDKIIDELGSRDIPLVMNSAPSIYASEDSGGAGDARVNVRGFSQRNVAILINGVPTNDMENGWLYWSNWDGLGDVSQSIQLQRGLSNTSLPLPSIGGVMNIITDPAASQKGGSLKYEMGSDNFWKVTGVINTGLLRDKFALTLAAVHKQGDGNFVHGWTKGEGYYVGAAWFVNERNRLELYGIAAPQQHAQRFDSNIAVFSVSEAKKFGYTDEQIAAVQGVPAARFFGSGPLDAGFGFNPNSAPINPSYSGQQYYWGKRHPRYEAGYMDERVNYFNKPQFNLNWFSKFSDTLRLATVFYYSGGRGGGSGTYGSVSFNSDKTSPFYQNRDFQATIVRNTNRAPDSAGERASYGILRNSVNNQDTFGFVGKLTYDFSSALSFTGGVDWRTAEIEHFREVRDLLGGDYYRDTSNQFETTETQFKKRLGDKVNYWNTNTVDWLGLFLTGNYKRGPVTAFATAGYSSISYGYTDHFHPNASGKEIRAEANNLNGSQLKGGLRYAFTKQFSAFANVGWVDRAPIFDGAIDDSTGQLVPDPTNEKYSSFEFGGRWATTDNRFWISANAYFTQWRDLTNTNVNEQADVVTYQRGINSNYNGIELESAWRPNRWLRFDAAASFGDWKLVSDVPYTQYTISTRQQIPTTNKLYLDGLKIGDQPQSQIAYAVTVFPTQGLSIKLQGRWYDDFYSDYDVLTRNNPNDRGQSWQIPSYTVYDLHVNYNIPQKAGPFEVNLFAHVFNLFDQTYISDASDNSSFEGLPIGYYGVQSHTAQTASVYFGLPLRWNIGARLRF